MSCSRSRARGRRRQRASGRSAPCSGCTRPAPLPAGTSVRTTIRPRHRRRSFRCCCANARCTRQRSSPRELSSSGPRRSDAALVLVGERRSMPVGSLRASTARSARLMGATRRHSSTNRHLHARCSRGTAPIAPARIRGRARTRHASCSLAARACGSSLCRRSRGHRVSSCLSARGRRPAPGRHHRLVPQAVHIALEKKVGPGKRLPESTKKGTFHCVYAVLHDPVCRDECAQNLKRAFPGVLLYGSARAEFRRWADGGRAWMDLHIGDEQAAPWTLKRTDMTAGKPAPQTRHPGAS
jgi:hypothetical protein